MPFELELIGYLVLKVAGGRTIIFGTVNYVGEYPPKINFPFNRS